MIKLLPLEQFSNVENCFDDYIEYFPIIISVIYKVQDGYILYDENFYCIVHKFGFSYILSRNSYTTVALSISFLEQTIFTLKNKISVFRIYDPQNNLKHNSTKKNLSKRVKLLYNQEMINNELEGYKSVKEVGLCNEKLFDLQLCSRFWNNCKEFEKKSYAYIYENHNKIEGICYSAAVSKQYTEIDIFVHLKYRGQNIGTNLVNKYIHGVRIDNLIPLWDCYTNNTPSYKLAKSIGFKDIFEFDFYNIKAE